jgi:fatty acid desaturase
MTMPTPLSDRTASDFAELSGRIRGAGLLERRIGYYATRIGVVLAAFAAVGVLFVTLGDSWWQIGTAVLLAVVTTQVAFVGHDAGHKQILRGRRANDVIGYAVGGLIGLSYGWWVTKHNRHHANPNHEEDDPDLDIPVLAFSVRQGGAKRGFVRWTAKYQGILFLPLLLLEGWSLHWSAVQAIWTGEAKRRRLETALLVVHFAVYFTVLFLVLSPLTALVFIAVHQGLWGLYMGLSFAPNHKGMPTTTGDQDWDFLRKQVLTSRNVRGGPVVDVVLGGLNYQVEHHLFPNMPQIHLRRAQPIVREFCAERGIPYAETTLLRSYGEVLTHLHAVGAPLRESAR